jgi:hypothetical protein
MQHKRGRMYPQLRCKRTRILGNKPQHWILSKTGLKSMTGFIFSGAWLPPPGLLLFIQDSTQCCCLFLKDSELTQPGASEEPRLVQGHESLRNSLQTRFACIRFLPLGRQRWRKHTPPTACLPHPVCSTYPPAPPPAPLAQEQESGLADGGGPAALACAPAAVMLASGGDPAVLASRSRSPSRFPSRSASL